jgi:hypothetical protein
MPADDLRAAYFRDGFDRLPDLELAARVARAVAVPRVDPADSFVLHAPLELVARVALLPAVLPAAREAARLRIFAIADQYEAFGPPVATPAATRFDSVAEGASRLLAAIEWGELDDVDEIARWLGRAASPGELQRTLTDGVTPRLAAAAHAPIFLYQLPRVAPRGELTGELLRGLARELARAPGWRLHWVDGRDPDGRAVSGDELFAAIAAVPGDPGDGPTPFIYPLMSAVDSAGVAAGALDAVTRGADIEERGRAVLRASAWSMLLEPPDHSPYGWSHCLTMPQAVLGVAGASADPAMQLAIAATYVVGFRAALARRALVPELEVPRVAGDWRDAFAGDTTALAAAVWHAPAGELDAVQVEVATRASIQRDAHLVKYTLACLDAAAADPRHRRLFLTAAASLVGWWSGVADADDPLAA